MRKETELFFDSVIREDRNVVDLISANYTFVNERLARFYGIPSVTGSDFRRIIITDPNRGGLLGQAAILAATSEPTRTSPVRRGKWVLENLLGAPPPPRPPDVPILKENEVGSRRSAGGVRSVRAGLDSATARCRPRRSSAGQNSELSLRLQIILEICGRVPQRHVVLLEHRVHLEPRLKPQHPAHLSLC
jgi:hypothetical protein